MLYHKAQLLCTLGFFQTQQVHLSVDFILSWGVEPLLTTPSSSRWSTNVSCPTYLYILVSMPRPLSLQFVGSARELALQQQSDSLPKSDS